MTPQPGTATGPTTAEGKSRSRLNALRHGLSGQTVLMPWEDQAAYQTHCASYLKTLAPIGDIETQAAQGVADDQWRLNRARAVDTNMFALGHFDYAPETGHPQIDAALTSARVFRDNSKIFVNLSLYEQRINRSLEKNFDRLEALQQARLAREREAKLTSIRENQTRPTAIAVPSKSEPGANRDKGTFVCASAPEPDLNRTRDPAPTLNFPAATTQPLAQEAA